MEEEAGRARVFAQGLDEPELVMEAIDCCPVNCISFVDHEDLVILETERDGLDGSDGQTINQRQAGYRHGDSHANRLAPTKAKLSTSTMVCNSCPTRGCKECPMYGVGLNPVYLQRLDEKERKRAASGEAAKQERDAERAGKVAALFVQSDGGAAAPEVSGLEAAELAAADGASALGDSPDELSGVATPTGQTEPPGGDDLTGVAIPTDIGAQESMVSAIFADSYGTFGDDDDNDDDDEMPPPLGLGSS